MRKYIVTIYDENNPREEFKRLASDLGFKVFMGQIIYNKGEERSFYISSLLNEWLKNPNLLEDMVKQFEKEDSLADELKLKIQQLGFKIYNNRIFKKEGHVGATILVSDKINNLLGGINYYDDGNLGFSFQGKTFTDLNEFKNYIAKYEKQELVKISKENKKEKEYNDFYNQSTKDILKNIKNNLDMLSDDVLTYGIYVGGYGGKSMSNSAYASKNKGSLPKTKWTKQKILDIITSNTKELDFVMPILKRLSFEDLKSICLYEDGWHHMGVAYNKIPFYSVDSPRNIVEKLIERGII